MKLYIDIREMIFEEDNIMHKIISFIGIKKNAYCDIMLTIAEDDKFIKDTFKKIYKKDKEGKDTQEIESTIFIVREQKTWWNFPLYEIVNGKIVDFNYKQYAYFNNMERRMILATKIHKTYHPAGENKIHRKTFKYIMDSLNIEYPDFFKKYNEKIEAIINKNLKN